ncbi:Bud emergence mediator [Scheffersomyces coipomensis]|uniref:Bud emergence mediator n=1 Tax=Scheffersomyces coipomensis TaxID=1788519 RepID=UPI00315D7A17
MMKSFRRSKRQSSNSTASSPKHSITRVTSIGAADVSDVLQSPKKVIKALYDYQPQGPGELKFSKGDFFHVLSDSVDDTTDGNSTDNSNAWYEATNPVTHVKGMVPVSYFEVFNRSRPVAQDTAISQGLTGNDIQNHNLQNQNQNAYPTSPTQLSRSNQRNSSQTLYAIVLYEFIAEREDELNIYPGENLIICAHHEFEWFIAKPINRLGGPGLVPVTYVKIIDLLNPNAQNPDLNPSNQDDITRTINDFKIPTVEQWKDSNAKYQASTIPLGSISSTNQTPPVSSNSQFFEKDHNNNGNGNGYGSNRSSLSSSGTVILEAGVDSYQLDHGRYQYLITAKLSNGKIRQLYRYYQDFYDLQVKLLELFPYEAGKIENSKRIIPSIPGPLINVNDNISKLRREKLDYYLRNLIALPNHISRSEEVLLLFEVLDNGFDKELITSDGGTNLKRSSKPISQQSNYHHERLSEYSSYPNNVSNSRNSYTPPTESRSRSSSTHLIGDTTAKSIPPSTQQPQTQAQQVPSQSQYQSQSQAQAPKVKVKFYFDEDIFVLLLPTNLRLQDLKTKLFKRLELEKNNNIESGQEFTPSDVQLFLKNDYDDFVNENNIVNEDFNAIQKSKLKEFEVDDDYKFHGILFDKCKLVILVS